MTSPEVNQYIPAWVYMWNQIPIEIPVQYTALEPHTDCRTIYRNQVHNLIIDTPRSIRRRVQTLVNYAQNNRMTPFSIGHSGSPARYCAQLALRNFSGRLGKQTEYSLCLYPPLHLSGFAVAQYISSLAPDFSARSIKRVDESCWSARLKDLQPMPPPHVPAPAPSSKPASDPYLDHPSILSPLAMVVASSQSLLFKLDFTLPTLPWLGFFPAVPGKVGEVPDMATTTEIQATPSPATNVRTLEWKGLEYWTLRCSG
ncbi:hypothetical protein P691DRAFT_785833 [Macrolepiota fuliginosa MF-IS2]|uniref:Uncharacterized protein n=1 Tax=Macrolepiota fuliginosa MF-IS2 TaxID=1400762 RepID=A0A9P5X7Y7_9AGAR|nr:hypothetical protein P691DRAFT_785833 [Macrolepiota fuliginosa MF-IS2]